MTFTQQNQETKDGSTAGSDGKVNHSQMTVYYDNSCFHCVSLAQFLASRSSGTGIEFRPSDEEKPKELVVVVQSDQASERYEGAEAWRQLLEFHPVFSEFSWLARKLGLERISADVVRTGAHLMRSLCFRCRRPNY